MNFVQFLLFTVYVCSVFIAGVSIYRFVNPQQKESINRFILIGEVLLLGSIFLIGSMVLLSILGLYSAGYLWGTVLLGFFFLFHQGSRRACADVFYKKIRWDFPLLVFILLVSIFLFRNMFFLVDVDSHSTYLYAQKLWLHHHSSLIGSAAMDVRVFVPHFNAVPYALGLSIFPTETLFPQLIVSFWTVIVMFLLFGYTSYVFNRYYGLAAVMMVLFNDHMFYSGVNGYVIINSALIAFLFSAAYNFWLARGREGFFRFSLALIFLAPLMANKYQSFYVLVFLFVVGCFIQKDLMKKVKYILKKKRIFLTLFLSIVSLLLWYVKNYFATGLATFPILAGKFGVFNWTSEMVDVFNKVYVGPLGFSEFLKYMSYLFVWPGVYALKLIIIFILFLPLIILSAFKNKPSGDDGFFEFSYWLSLSIFVVLGLCLVSFVDPRAYRYGIAIFAFTAVFGIDYILRNVFRVRNMILLVLVVVIVSLPGYKIIFSQGGALRRPSIKDNLGVLTNRLHFEDIQNRYFPENRKATYAALNNEKKFRESAWDTGVGGVNPFSAFLLPIRPQVGLWHTTVIQWDSYQDAELIVKDLKGAQIQWIMRMENGEFVFMSIEKYAQEAVNYNLQPERLFYNYGFPDEILKISY